MKWFTINTRRIGTKRWYYDTDIECNSAFDACSWYSVNIFSQCNNIHNGTEENPFICSGEQYEFCAVEKIK